MCIRDSIYIVSTQDTDISPFDTGAYASRQTYVSGKALKQTAQLLKERILDYGSYLLKMPSDALDIQDNNVVDKESRECLVTLEALATEAFYSLDRSVPVSYTHLDVYKRQV